jgi:hypothetical protein
MPDQHAPLELQVFEAFLASMGRHVDPARFTKRPPPEPDILFDDEAEGPRAFELVRIIEENWARARAETQRLQRAVEAAYEALPEATKSAFDERYSAADVTIHFLSTASRNVRNNSISAIFTRLSTLPPQTEGGLVHDDPEFRHVMDRVYVRFHPSFKKPHLGVAIGAYVSDATLDLIRRKIENFSSYSTDAPVELLAHTDLTPQQFSIERSGPPLASYLASLRHVPYFRIWIFDTQAKQSFLIY